MLCIPLGEVGVINIKGREDNFWGSLGDLSVVNRMMLKLEKFEGER